MSVLPSRVLLVKLSSLGDVVHSLPLVAALRSGLGPDAHIAWAVGKAFAPLVEGNPHVSRVHILPKKSAGEVLSLGGTLRAESFDTALDAQGLLVSGVVALLSGAKRRIGFDTGREGNRLFLTDASVPGKERRHIVDRLLGFCDVLNIPRPATIAPQTYLTTGDVSGLLAPAQGGKGPLIGCIVGASVANKTWPAECWGEAIQHLAAQGMRPVLLGAKNEAEAAAVIARNEGDAVAANLVGKTNLRELAAVLANCAVVIGPDSGPTHLAVAVGTPVVGLYGVTDPARTGPDWGPAPAVVLDYVQKEAPPETRRPRHPTLTDSLARIPAEAVVDAVMHLMEAHSRTRGSVDGVPV